MCRAALVDCSRARLPDEQHCGAIDADFPWRSALSRSRQWWIIDVLDMELLLQPAPWTLERVAHTRSLAAPSGLTLMRRSAAVGHRWRTAAGLDDRNLPWQVVGSRLYMHRVGDPCPDAMVHL